MQRGHGDIALTNGGLRRGRPIRQIAQGTGGGGDAQVIVFSHAKGLGIFAQLICAELLRHLHKSGIARQRKGGLQGYRILAVALLVGIVSQLRHRVWQGNDIGTGQSGGGIKTVVQARRGGDDLEDGTRRQRFCTGVVDQRLSLLLLQVGPNILGGITH